MPCRILIVEDEWLIAIDYAAVLRDAGHEVVGPCASVNTALSVLDDSPIDAALLDMELRGEKSFGIAERLRDRDIPFVFLSGHSVLDLPPGMQGQHVLSKPIHYPALLETVAAMCPNS